MPNKLVILVANSIEKNEIVREVKGQRSQQEVT